jgi:hypothetical protein
MAPHPIEDLTRSLIQPGSRRAALAGLLASSLGLFRFAAIDAKKKRKKKKKKTASLVPGPQSPSTSCSDGLQNGSESDVDCGGSCTRCLNGKTCTTRNDCAGALCSGNICAECASHGQCGTDTNGAACLCEPTVGGPRTCNRGGDAFATPRTCEQCPPGTNCIAQSSTAFCVKPCGAP